VITNSGGLGVSGATNIGGITKLTSGTASTLTTNGTLVVTGGVGISGTTNIGGITKLTSDTASSAYTGGALVVTGGVGIGGAVYTNSTINANGQITGASFNTPSDYRIKENVKMLFRSIDQLNPVEYDLSGGRHDMGFIAHEVQEIFPFLVNGEKDGEQLQSINYTGFISLLVKEVQELKKENKHLYEINDKFENRLKVLENMFHI
jgi:hypothetical protein